jgi:hypothetical protein
MPLRLPQSSHPLTPKDMASGAYAPKRLIDVVQIKTPAMMRASSLAMSLGRSRGWLRAVCTYGALNTCGPLLSIYAQRIHYRLR